MKVHEISSEIQTLWNDLGFSLYTALSVYCIVIISEGRKKSKIEISTDWYVVIEHWGSSLIRVIFVDYQTIESQYNY